ncbi:MAG: ribosome small subunit-dependent GTPase A [Halobacteria archaeon]|nr:ribosome small subunit-dependent GTPase A [Halobacteria archaeon]
MSARQPPDSNQPDRKSDAATRAGLVIVNYGKNLLVEDDDGALYQCVARRGLQQLACGDAVDWQPTGEQAGVVEILQPRNTVLLKADGRNRQRPLAANFDQVVIEAATEPAMDAFLIDKYTIAAELAGATPLIIINKADLLSAADRQSIESLMQEFRAIGYRYLFTSALENTGIDAFRDQLTGRTSILVGQSGVGKSSLIKRLLPEQDIAVGRLSTASGQGKHTTTTTTLYHLPGGGNLIDSPGVRDFRLGEVDPNTLGNGFREFIPHLGRCRFNDCLHLTEPGCAVIEAVNAGRISERRMESYRRLQSQ